MSASAMQSGHNYYMLHYNINHLCGHYTGQLALASTSSQELDDFVQAKTYCPHALADSR